MTSEIDDATRAEFIKNNPGVAYLARENPGILDQAIKGSPNFIAKKQKNRTGKSKKNLSSTLDLVTTVVPTAEDTEDDEIDSEFNGVKEEFLKFYTNIPDHHSYRNVNTLRKKIELAKAHKEYTQVIPSMSSSSSPTTKIGTVTLRDSSSVPSKRSIVGASHTAVNSSNSPRKKGMRARKPKKSVENKTADKGAGKVIPPEVLKLKKKYKEVWGKPPGGSKANESVWLKKKIAEKKKSDATAATAAAADANEGKDKGKGKGSSPRKRKRNDVNAEYEQSPKKGKNEDFVTNDFFMDTISQMKIEISQLSMRVIKMENIIDP